MGLLLSALVACCWVLRGDATTAVSSERLLPSVIIITLDGVRWQEILDGCDARRHQAGSNCSAAELVPNLHQLAHAQGAILGAKGDASFTVRGPSYVSLPGYQQLFTGRSDVGCDSNECGRVAFPTIAEAVAKRYGKEEAWVFSSWPTLAQAASSEPSAVSISAGQGGSGPGYRPDDETAALALEQARAELPRLLFVGLGDTDEVAHTGDYDAYLDALQRADAWIGHFARLAEQRRAKGGPTTLFVTTDHGRAEGFKEHERAPEAARTWLIAAGTGVTTRGSVSAAPHTIADIAPTVAKLLRVKLPAAKGQPIDALSLAPHVARRRPHRLAFWNP